MTKFFIRLTAVLTVLCLWSCISDDISTAPDDQPAFSTDTLRLGSVFSGQGSPTSHFTVYNRHDRIITLDRVAMHADAGYCRLNVDGTAGREISGIQIRPGDSVMVFLEVNYPADVRGRVLNHVDVTVAGRTSTVPVLAEMIAVERLRGVTLPDDMTVGPEMPILVSDSLVVPVGTTLTLLPGAHIYMHDKAVVRVYGRIRSLGSAGSPVVITGDRLHNVVGGISFDLMSGQWKGMVLSSADEDNTLNFTVVKNSERGLLLEPGSRLSLNSCVLRNAEEYPLSARGTKLTATGCDIADGGAGAVCLDGGDYIFDHCTLANYYLFSAVGAPVLQTGELTKLSLSMTNSIIFGLGGDLEQKDYAGSGVTFARCLLASSGNDDANFAECLWGSDPQFYVDRSKYIFDYHIHPESPAANAAKSGVPVLSPLGEDISSHLGAYPPR